MAVAPKTITQPAHEVHEFSSTRKWIIAFSVMLGTVLEVLDSSIAAQLCAAATASVAPLPSLTFGSRRPLLGQGEVRSRYRPGGLVTE